MCRAGDCGRQEQPDGKRVSGVVCQAWPCQPEALLGIVGQNELAPRLLLPLGKGYLSADSPCPGIA